jgi:iron complex outermembrane recepter protein
LKPNRKLQSAIVAVLSVHAAAAYAAEQAGAAGEIADIVVTAQRRSESIQNVPITIQALTAESLSELNVTTFDDFIKYVPNVVAGQANGPAQGNIYMRGLSVGGAGTQSSGTIGGFPNVAVYLDEQSGQLPNRNMDIYAADLDRIEVLEGPQGSLFGGGAQAGVLRYITTKPKLNVFEGAGEASYGTTAHGDPNTAVQATLNLPLIADKLAVRAVVYSDRRGGYINNVASTFTRKNTDLGLYYLNYAAECSVGRPTNGVCPAGSKLTKYGVPANSPVINNDAVVGDATNPVTYQGGRLQALYQVNDDWSVLIAQSYQNMDAQGYFYQYPTGSDGQALPPLSITLFNLPDDRDKFTNTAWTINGKVGDLRAIYTGGYLVRHIDQVGDYTNYSRGYAGIYYQCHGNIKGVGGNPDLAAQCYTPSSTWTEKESLTHSTHELRVSTPDDWRLRGLVGAYWEDYKINDSTSWQYGSLPPCTVNQQGCHWNIGANPTSGDPNLAPRSDKTDFFEDTIRENKQTAFFASVDFDIIPKVLTLTAGSRQFRYDMSFKGAVSGSYGCFPAGSNYYYPAYNGPSPCLAEATDITGEHLQQTFSGHKSRVSLTWHVTPDTMLYYTYSQGFRPGGFNRKSDCHAPGTDGVNQFCIPLNFGTDALTNNEVGFKTEFLNRHVQFNGSVYQENWDGVQIGFFNPGSFGNLTFGTNGQNFRIRGVELQLVAHMYQGLTFQGSGSWNQSEQTNSPFLQANNPASNNFGKPVTQICSSTGTNCAQIQNPFGAPGSSTANSPPIQFSARLRYDWQAGDYNAFAQIGVSHIGHSFTQTSLQKPLVGTGINTTLSNFEDPAYSTYDASFGVGKDKWTATVYGQNLGDVNASMFTSTAQFIVSQTPTRPRVLGARLNYKF